MSIPRFPISFADGQVALGVRPSPGVDLGRSLRAMGLTTGVPTLALVADGGRPSQLDRLGPLLEKVVVPVVAQAGASVVETGAAGGIGARLAVACARKKVQFPIVGVGDEAQATTGQGLNPGHTHFVVVAADAPGWTASAVSTVTTALAGGNRSVALVAGGGEPAWAAVSAHARAGRMVMAVARTGGVADHLAAALAGRSADGRAEALARSGQVCAVDPGRGAAAVADVVRSALSRPDAIGPAPAPR